MILMNMVETTTAEVDTGLPSDAYSQIKRYLGDLDFVDPTRPNLMNIF